MLCSHHSWGGVSETAVQHILGTFSINWSLLLCNKWKKSHCHYVCCCVRNSALFAYVTGFISQLKKKKRNKTKLELSLSIAELSTHLVKYLWSCLVWEMLSNILCLIVHCHHCQNTDWNKYDDRLMKAVERGEVDKVAAVLSKKGIIPTKLDVEGRSAWVNTDTHANADAHTHML